MYIIYTYMCYIYIYIYINTGGGPPQALGTPIRSEPQVCV